MKTRLEGYFARVFWLPMCWMLASCSSDAWNSSSVLVRNGELGPNQIVSSKLNSYQMVNRLTWGASSNAISQLRQQGWQPYLDDQLHPKPSKLASGLQEQIEGMTIMHSSLLELIQKIELMRKEADAIKDDDAKKSAQQAYQQELNRLQRESATRHVLRALYSPHQVHEKMTWFWLNHFNVHQGKSNLRAMVGDYEETAIRPNALGNFRELLGAVAKHPAMLRYLDNEQNAVNRLNENFARELMELHTLGVDGGYTQRDVQELARILTGYGLNATSNNPQQKRELQTYYFRRGLFEFNPSRHDFGEKVFLNKATHTKGIEELNEALDRLALHPSTAHFLSRKLAVFWLTDNPPNALVNKMASAYLQSKGEISVTLNTLFNSREFTNATDQKFKDPFSYVISAIRLTYDQKTIINSGPILNWLNRMGEPLYGRVTPDGYSLSGNAWNSPGQMATRFEVAKAIGTGSAGLFKADGPQAQERVAFPQLSNALFFQWIEKTLAPTTLKALEQANSPQEWNTFLLSSPEMMYR